MGTVYPRVDVIVYAVITVSFSLIPVSLLSLDNIAPFGDGLEAEAGMLLPVMEQFYTIQGEGYNTGRAAYFIRLGGCDVGCVWCDVKES